MNSQFLVQKKKDTGDIGPIYYGSTDLQLFVFWQTKKSVVFICVCAKHFLNVNLNG